MRPRRVKNQEEIIESSKYFLSHKDIEPNHLYKVFGNYNPIRMEIGMGKGDFIIGMAEKYPDINVIGIEVQSSVLVRAIKKIDELELPNVRVMNVDAINLANYIGKDIEHIYLNFSDPWPKTRHAKRRLTSDEFLKVYDQIFIENPQITMKTDNIGLFAYSIEQLVKHGYIFNKVSLDLANEDIDNVLTEYEKKFMNKGERINYLDAVKYLEK